MESSTERPRLWEWLQHESSVEHPLPWCRTLDAYDFMEMVERGACIPNQCKVFDEPLIYFFYGRPAFRFDENDVANGIELPVVLVFNTDIVGAGRRMYPFDSGAFVAKRYSGSMHRRMKLGHFALPVGIDAAMKFVAAFFGTNRGYMRTAARRPVRKFNGEYEVKSLVNLYSAAGRKKADDRRQAVELQIPEPLDLFDGKLLAIVYPDELADSTWFPPFAAKLPGGVRLFPYEVIEEFKPIEYQATLEGFVRSLAAAQEE